MDQSEEAALTIVENWWKKSFDISKDKGDPIFSLFTKSFETIMVYMSQSLDYEYIERELSLLDKDRQLALQSENSYDAHRCLSFGLIEAVQMMMKKNTKKLEELIKQGYVPVPEIPKFLLHPKEEMNMDDLETIPAENEISSPTIPQEIITQPIDEFSQDFASDVQTYPLAFTDQDFYLKEEEMIDDDVADANSLKEQPSIIENSIGIAESTIPDLTRARSNGPNGDELRVTSGDNNQNSGMDDFAQEIDNSLIEYPLDDEIMNEPNGIFPDENVPLMEEISSDNEEMTNENSDLSSNQTMKERRKSTRRVSRPVKFELMDDTNDEEVEPMIKKTRLDLVEESGKIMESSENKVADRQSKTARAPNATELECPDCDYRTRRVSTWFYHLRYKHSTTPTKAGLVLRCECGDESISDIHNRVCKIANFTIIRRRNSEVNVRKRNETELECPKCLFRTMCVKTWTNHLRNKHLTNPTKAGVLLRCECGHEGLSGWHAGKCEMANFTVIRKTDQLLFGRSNDDKEPLCEFTFDDI